MCFLRSSQRPYVLYHYHCIFFGPEYFYIVPCLAQQRERLCKQTCNERVDGRLHTADRRWALTTLLTHKKPFSQQRQRGSNRMNSLVFFWIVNLTFISQNIYIIYAYILIIYKILIGKLERKRKKVKNKTEKQVGKSNNEKWDWHVSNFYLTVSLVYFCGWSYR